MADQEQLKILRSGIRKWNAWRKENPNTRIDLSEADLCGANLNVAHLSEARLAEADLTGAALIGSTLIGTNLARANLTGASLVGANLTGASLVGANLSHANLIGTDLALTDLNAANLNKANLKNALLNETIFADLDLHVVVGLDSCRHAGPSILDYRTLVRSSGPLPLAFLRGCGLPDSLIEYLPSLLGTAIQFYSCFISYSTQDQEFADRLHADLQNQGVRCWFAPHNIHGGKKVHEQIDEAIRMYDRLLLILSDHSMNSEWVKTEIARARQKELKENRRVLFPISVVPFEKIKYWTNFDADTGKDSAREIREYFIPDFSKWKDHDAYSKGFEGLLRDLKAEKQTGAEA